MSQKWFLYYNDTQLGPYSQSEVQTQIHAGQLTEEVFAWTQGMEDWQELGECSEFQFHSQKPKRDEKRKHPRKPLLAKVISTDQKEISFGMCHDVSLGGMQVLTDVVPAEPNTQIQLNVSSSDSSLPAFTATGTVIRILENQRGFSFRFDDLSEDVKEIIKQYVKDTH